MNFYITKIVFRIDVTGYVEKQQYEEKLLLIKALNIKNAYKRSLELGSMEETEFVNANGHLIQWRMEGITHLSKLTNISEDTELFSELKDDYSEVQADILKSRIDSVSKKFIAI